VQVNTSGQREHEKQLMLTTVGNTAGVKECDPVPKIHETSRESEVTAVTQSTWGVRLVCLLPVQH